MKQIILCLLIFLSLKGYCQESSLLPPDSLLKINKVKKVKMISKSKRGSGENLYYYNKAGNLQRHETISPISNDALFVTDYFFDSSGKRYASLMHGSESRSSYSSFGSRSTWQFTSGFSDSILYYYEYNLNKQFKRIYRLYPSGKMMFENLFTYEPKIVTRRSFNEEGKLTGETIEYYEKDQFITKSVLKRFDNAGNMISTFTQDFGNSYNTIGQLEEVNYRNDTCACINKYKYYSNGLLKSHSNVACRWNKKFTYKYYK